MLEKHKFKTEAELCEAFMHGVPDDWIVYPETGGFDIVLVRKEDGFQIGIEAKLKLNAKVICQAAENIKVWNICRSGPDCRAVLIPCYVGIDLSGVCKLLGLQITRANHPDDKSRFLGGFNPHLPRQDWDYDEAKGEYWFEFCPEKRLVLPDYVPDTGAGCSAPVKLTKWKIKAIKIAVTLEKRGYVTRKDFKHIDISMSRWTQAMWIIKDGYGRWVETEDTPDFKNQHPVNYKEISADYEQWCFKENDLFNLKSGGAQC